MNTQELQYAELKSLSIPSKTNNEEFEKNGFLLVKNLWNPKDLFCEVPEYRGQINYYGKIDKFTFSPIESQVNGSLSRYTYPPYKYYHSQIKKKIEKIIGKELFNTYYYDRFYFPGQKLDKHVDRDACEISVTLNISTNLNKCWPIYVKSPNQYDENSNIKNIGKEFSLCLNPGDGVIYKGCERPHWREEMPSKYGKFERFIRKIRNLDDDSYYHQVFFHYVLADGYRSHFAGDKR